MLNLLLGREVYVLEWVSDNTPANCKQSRRKFHVELSHESVSHMPGSERCRIIVEKVAVTAVGLKEDVQSHRSTLTEL